MLVACVISAVNVYVCVTGEEGPSLMGLEDVAMFRALPTATIFYPSDGVSTEKAVELAASTKVLQVFSSLQHQFSFFLKIFVFSFHKKGCLLYPNQSPRQCHHLQQQ